MANFNKLELRKAKAEEQIDFDKPLPEQRGGFQKNLLPHGSFGFEIPEDIADLWTAIEAGDEHGQRIAVEFSATSPLKVVSSNGNGQGWEGRISNVPRNRGKKGEPKVLVPDLLYVLQAVGADLSGIKAAGGQLDKLNVAYAKALSEKAGAQFEADNEWTAFCNAKKVRYVAGEQQEGQSYIPNVEDPEGKAGCGANYYYKDIPLGEDGQKATRMQCNCGASLFVNQGLQRFRARR